MKKFVVVLMMIVFSLVGCEKQLYVHPTKTAQDFERDQDACRKEFPVYASNMGFAPVIHVTTAGMGECLRARGWTLKGEQEVNPATKSK